MLHVPSDYELVIRLTRGWFHVNLTDLLRYRDLLFLLVHRDFVARYKQTILGPAWNPRIDRARGRVAKKTSRCGSGLFPFFCAKKG
jgi:hypothetical protein